MKRSFIISVMLLLLITGAYAANTAPKLGGEIGMANEEFIGPNDGQGRPQTPAQSMYQAFVLEPQTYTYLYAGFMKDRPNSDPNVIPASLTSYTMAEFTKVVPAGTPNMPAENEVFITDPLHPLWVWWRIKSNDMVKISLIFEKFYLEGNKNADHYLPYIALYEPNGETEVGRGGWRPNSKDGRGKTGYTEYGVDPTTQTATVILLDETEIKNPARAEYYLIKVEGHFHKASAGTKASSMKTGEYKMPLKIRIEVK